MIQHSNKWLEICNILSSKALGHTPIIFRHPRFKHNSNNFRTRYYNSNRSFRAKEWTSKSSLSNRLSISQELWLRSSRNNQAVMKISNNNRLLKIFHKEPYKNNSLSCTSKRRKRNQQAQCPIMKKIKSQQLKMIKT